MCGEDSSHLLFAGNASWKINSKATGCGTDRFRGHGSQQYRGKRKREQIKYNKESIRKEMYRDCDRDGDSHSNIGAYTMS